jgi:hypothetical protein
MSDIIIINSCYPLCDTGRQQNVAIWSYLWPSSSPRSSSSLFLMPHCGPIFATSASVSLSSFSPAGSNPRPLFQILHSLSSVYVLSKSISVFLSVWISRFPLSFSKVMSDIVFLIYTIVSAYKYFSNFKFSHSLII